MGKSRVDIELIKCFLCWSLQKKKQKKTSASGLIVFDITPTLEKYPPPQKKKIKLFVFVFRPTMYVNIIVVDHFFTQKGEPIHS